MTRETKVGIAVAASFLSLVSVVVAAKLAQKPESAAGKASETALAHAGEKTKAAKPPESKKKAPEPAAKKKTPNTAVAEAQKTKKGPGQTPEIEPTGFKPAGPPTPPGDPPPLAVPAIDSIAAVVNDATGTVNNTANESAKLAGQGVNTAAANGNSTLEQLRAEINKDKKNLANTANAVSNPTGEIQFNIAEGAEKKKLLSLPPPPPIVPDPVPPPKPLAGLGGDTKTVPPPPMPAVTTDKGPQVAPPPLPVVTADKGRQVAAPPALAPMPPAPMPPVTADIGPKIAPPLGIGVDPVPPPNPLAAVKVPEVPAPAPSPTVAPQQPPVAIAGFQPMQKAPPSAVPGPPVPPLGAAPQATGPAVAVRSQASAIETRSYTTDSYSVRPSDKTFDDVTRSIYGDESYSRALLQFNRDHPLAQDGMKRNPPLLLPGTPVYYPDKETLRSKYPEAFSGAAPPPPANNSVPAVQFSKPAPIPGPGFPNASAVPPTTTSKTGLGGPGAGNTYRVRDGGETLFDIARATFGDGNRWTQIYRLNPNVQPSYPVPGGTILKLPTN